MQADSKQLGVVTITGSRPVIEHRSNIAAARKRTTSSEDEKKRE